MSGAEVEMIIEEIPQPPDTMSKGFIAHVIFCLCRYGDNNNLRDSVDQYLRMISGTGEYWHLFATAADAIVDFNEWFQNSYEYLVAEDGKEI